MRVKHKIGLAGILLAFPEIAHAHEFHGAGGLISGLTHPVLGLDHLLAMISVGVLSAQIGGRAIWSVPLTFVLVMLVGGVLGIAQVPLPFVESGIAISVIALGAVIAVGKTMPTVVAMYFVGIFAVFHGHAHGSEMPSLAQPALYALGFGVGTAGIHIAGVGIGVGALRFKNAGPSLLRLAGAGVAVAGITILVGS
jgi:urease accessory protein